MRLKKSKRLVSLLLAGSMMVSMVPASAVTAFAAEINNVAVMSEESNTKTNEPCSTEGQESTVQWTFNSATGELTISGTGAMCNYSAANSGQPWQNYLQGIKKIVIESGITSIGDFAFMGAENAQTVILPEGLTRIGQRAFANCKSLISPKFPSTLTEIGANPFYSCNAFDVIELPNGLTTMGSMLFYECENLTQINIPASAASIPQEFVKGCSKLKSIQIPANITEIGAGAFAQTGLEEITIPETVTVLGASIVNSCASLKKATFEGTAKIESATFDNCTNLKEIIFEKNNFDLHQESNSYLFGSWAQNCVIELKDKSVSQETLDKIKQNTADGAAVIIAIMDGGEIADNNASLTAKKNGYTFAGWYKNADFSGEAVTTPTAGNTYYAKWLLNASMIEPAAACKVTVENGTAWVGDQQVEFVAPGETVTIKANQDIVDGMKFSHWEVRKGKVELANAELDETTFVMPAEPVEVAVMLKDEASDDGIDAATVITGVAIGAGAAVLTYHIGTELYAEQVLGKGVAVPKTREDVALKAWELAGKPAVAMDGEPLSETTQAEKWATESGLMQNDAEGNFNGTKKTSKLKALRVLDSAKKMNAQ